jgi:acetyl/propionyl-CoA carboxylase alpha subunit
MTSNPVMDRKKHSHGRKEYGTTLSVTEKTTTCIRWIKAQSTRKQVMDTQKDAYMQEHLKRQETSVKPTPQTGKVDIHAAREGLAMVMDALRVMEMAGARTKATPLSDGKTFVLLIEIPGHGIGVAVMDGKKVITTDGVSVMDKFPGGHGRSK